MSVTPEDLKTVYLIISDQRLLVEQALSRLMKRVGETADLDFNMQVFDGENLKADDVIIACNTLPFGSERRLVIVKGIDKLQKDGLDALAAYAADPSPTTVLALAGEKLAKNTRLFKAVDRLGGVLERKAPTRREFPSRVTQMFADRGKRITPDAAELFVDVVGRDLQQITVEIEKAVSFVGKDIAEITRADVEEITALTGKRSVFDFTEALADRDCRRALKLQASILADGSNTEHGLLAMSVRTIRDLMAAQSLDRRGITSTYEIARQMGRPDWQIKRMPKQARAFAEGELVSLLKAAADAEGKMKTSRDTRLVLERWIVKVCAG